MSSWWNPIEWVKDIIDTLVDLIGSVGKLISDLVDSLAKIIADIAAKLVKDIGRVVADLTEGVAFFAREMLPGLSTNLFNLISLDIEVSMPLANFTILILDSIREQQEIVKGDVSKEIDDIEFLVTVSYTGKMVEIFNQVRRVSEQMEIGEYTLLLIIEIARTKTMASSNLIGRGYDLTQISWIQEMQFILEKISENARAYTLSPWFLINDIDKWVIRDMFDASAKAQQFNLMGLEKTVEGLTEAVKDIDKVRKKIDDHINKLPGFIKDRVKPEIDKVNKTIDKFIDYTYLPALSDVDNSIDGLKKADQDLDTSILNIQKRIRRPGEYLTEIDRLDPNEKLEDENWISEIASRIFGRKTKDFNDESKDARERLDQLRDQLGDKLPSLPSKAGASRLPHRVKRGKASRRDTWFVGDY